MSSFDITDPKNPIKEPRDVKMILNIPQEIPKSIFNHYGHIQDPLKWYRRWLEKSGWHPPKKEIPFSFKKKA